MSCLLKYSLDFPLDSHILNRMLNCPDPVDGVFRALADGTRRQMLDRLAQGDASVSELAAPLDMSLAAVLQQIQYLEGCGVVRSRKEGRTRICTLDRSAFQQAENWLSRRRALWESSFDRLGELLREPPTGNDPGDGHLK